MKPKNWDSILILTWNPVYNTLDSKFILGDTSENSLPLYSMWLTHCNSLSCFEGEFRWELVDDGSTGAHLPLHLPVAQRLVLRTGRQKSWTNDRTDHIWWYSSMKVYYDNKKMNKLFLSVADPHVICLITFIINQVKSREYAMSTKITYQKCPYLSDNN